MLDQYFSALLWIFISASSLVIVLVALFMYFWYAMRIKAVTEDGANIATLAAEKDNLQADIEQCRKWIENSKEELLKLEAERKQQEFDRQELANLQSELAQKEQEDIERRKEAADLQNVVSSLSQDRDRLKEQLSELDIKRTESEEKMKAASEQKQRAEFEAQKVQIDLEEKQREIRDINLKNTEQSLKSESFAKEIHFKRMKLDELENTLKEANIRTDQAIKEANEEKQKLYSLNLMNKELERDIQEKQRHLNELIEKVNERSIQDKSLANEITRKQLRLEDLEGFDDKGHDAYATLFEAPETFKNVGLNSSQHDDFTEEKALEDLKKYLSECKLSFPTRVLKAFHTSLKIADISSLVVMAGISGTGKTELPRRYAEALGIHFLLMAVQPRWDSPQDMFGFYNYLEHRYRATELARSLIHMDKWNHKDKAGFSDRVLLVLLDEMNLARIEYYFSEFLSKLEIRRSIDPDKIEDRRKAEISLDVGSHLEKGPRLYVHENVLFVGTMNEDESTQTLSDKVVDRANVLRFGRPEKLISMLPEITNKSDKFLPLSVWKSWHKKIEHLSPSACKDIEEWIEKLNEGLDSSGRPFGYRINQAIFSYAANYPAVNTQNNHRLAFSDQLEQRILPKLRGLDIQENLTCFEKIGEVIENVQDAELKKAYDERVNPQRGNVLFSWHGVSRKMDQ